MVVGNMCLLARLILSMVVLGVGVSVLVWIVVVIVV